MTRRAIIPAGLDAAAAQTGMTPAIAANGFLFLTGATGSGPNGVMPADPEAQIRQAFSKISQVLVAADLTFDAVVEMTSYHIGLRAHFDLFDRIRREVFAAPYPAWTAVEAAGLRRERAIVEIRIIASHS
ncbi:Rid family hydrolase [Aestuariibius sp. 2305UL40-4]|uniref:Rid family hydrolase n=1 Tax=Aestuariibius violaceus TaxID=3234132 RepID=UPI00345F05D5